MSRTPYLQRQREREHKRQQQAAWKAKQQVGRAIKCQVCGRVITQEVLCWGNGGDFGVGKACSQTCFEAMRNV